MAESRVKDESFIVVQGWMLNKLQLKGTELLIYACIFGFSQNDQYFNGSVQYLADWTNSTKRSIYNNLDSLVNKGFIEKKESYVNGVKQCEYRAIDPAQLQGENNSLGGEKSSLGGEKSSLGGGEKSSLGGGEKSSPNNIDNNNIDFNNIVCIPIFEKIEHTYNKICTSLVPLKRMTAKRKKAVTKILSKYSHEELEDIFKRAEASEYCRGSREGWKANFDWLMDEDNIAKLLEGNYDRASKSKGRKEQVPDWMNKDQHQYDYEELEASILANGSSPIKRTVANDPALQARADNLKKSLVGG